MHKKLLLVGTIMFGISDIQGLSLYQANMWQSKDVDGTTLPYFSQTFLQELQKWDVKDWSVFIWGAGDCPTESTLFWFARKCKKVTYVDWYDRWIGELNNFIDRQLHMVNKVLFKCRAIERIEKNDPLLGKVNVNIFSNFGMNSSYVNAVAEDGEKYDCVIVDGYHRNSCISKAITHIKPGGVIILNNANQQTLGINSTQAYQLLAKYPHKSCLHPGHLDWRTDYWIIN